METYTTAVDQMSVRNLRTEYLENPLGIDARTPRLSWIIEARRRGVSQSAYQVQVARDADAFSAGKECLWDSGKVASAQTLAIQYAGAKLGSRQRCYWRVRSWDENDCASDWSEAAWWEMGLLEEKDWSAEWVEVDWEEDPKAFKPCPYFRRGFTLDQPVKSARLFISAHGLYEAWLNGKRVGDQVFTPGYTPYDLQLQYQVYDVSDLLQAGENLLGAILGDGWYRGSIYISANRNVYGTRLGLLAQLVIETLDGRQVIVGTDAQWKATTGPIIKSDMREGEIFDARLEMPGWCSAGFDATNWKGVRLVAQSKRQLVASMGVAVRRKETFRPSVLRTPKGETVLDFGQNLAGVVHMQVQGARGTVVRLLHGETLDKDGNFTMDNLFVTAPKEGKTPAFQEVLYTLKGEGVEEYEPRFSVHGFRYAKIEGYPGEPSADDFYSVAIYSDMPPTGTFACSDALITQLHKNVEWSMKSNFLDLPTDCPQRERAGWTGDAQIFTPSASFLMDTRAFYRKWLKELSLEQFPSGMVGNFVPNPYRLTAEGMARMLRLLDGSSGWGDVAVMMPWALYWAYDDRQILEEQYASMKAWVDYMHKTARRVNWSRLINPRYWFDRAYRERQQLSWDTGYHWGEWLEPGGASVPAMLKDTLGRILFGSSVVATAYFAHSAGIVAKTAALLGKAEDAEQYAALAERVKAAYIAENIAGDGRMNPDRQAAYVRVLAFDLYPAEQKAAIVAHLLRLVKAAGNHIGTGFLSTVYLCQVLSENGHLDVAYELLTQKTIPSWLYAVSKGATTIWESWEGIREDGTPQLSLNHYSPGAVINFLHRTVAGIEAAAPGYRRITIHPRPGGGLSSACAEYHSVRGLIRSAWVIEQGRLCLEVTIPANTSAVITLPGAAVSEVRESERPLAQAAGLTNPLQVGADTQVDASSGTYTFEYLLHAS
jgi:alpha-L-rhamnosidase